MRRHRHIHTQDDVDSDLLFSACQNLQVCPPSTMSDVLDPQTAPTYSIKEGRGWIAVFNPDAPRQMDAQLHKCYVHDT